MSDRRLAWACFAAAFLMRAVTVTGTTIYGTDGAQFLLMADWMSEGRFQEALAVTYHPLFPLITAAFKPFFRDTVQSGFWVSAVLGSAAALPLFHLVRSVFGRPAAFFATLFFAFQPHTVELHSDAMSEGTFTFFFFSAAWLGWRVVQEPSLERSALAGLAAAGAYLTRPEGILAVALVTAWPLAALAAKRDRPWIRGGGAAVTVMAAVLVSFPFLVWVHSVMGRWTLSAKAPAALVEKQVKEEVGPGPEVGEQAGGTAWTPRYLKFVKGMGRVLYLTAPFMILGFWGLRGHPRLGVLYYFSFPLGYLGGLLYAMRSVQHTSYRYVLPSMNLLMVLGALGMVVAIRFLARRLPERSWVPAAALGAALVCVPMGLPCLRPQRADEKSLLAAVKWLKEAGRPGARVYSTTDKVNYLLGGGFANYPDTLEVFLAGVKGKPADYYLYLERDLDSKWPPYLARIREVTGAGDAVVIPGAPGWKVFIHPAAR